MQRYRAGIDIGSTTVKLVMLDASGQILFGKYRRHQAHTQETLAELLSEARETVGECMLRIRITGSGSINLGKALGIEFVQEVVAVATALQQTAPQTDVAIELGGEDAKIIYFTGGLEERMNGVCAGGTGSFIDQMAALLQTDAAGLNREAEHYQQIYPIAARCGVFAKTDIQPLINEGATRADLAASIFQAVVNQTISGLACGKPISGCVAFLGGPLHFLPELKKAFIRTLGLTAETTVDPENSHLFAAMGAALESGESDDVSIDTLISRLEQGVAVSFEMPRLPALFPDRAAYDAFCARHARATVAKGELAAYRGECFLGIDAGSTTTKLALVGERGELLYSFYTGNSGNPIEAAKRGIRALRDALPAGAKIVRSCSTGYGEALLKSAFSLDEGEVETIAHCTAAAFFDPAVDCVLDIGGQDMKCIRLKGGAVDSIMLNEACSSGCGSFIENFANSLGYTAQDFAKTALFAGHPVDLGTRCTVFMNSNVKQAQKEGASVADISAGLAYSVIKNALYKVIKLSSAEELGHHIVVQGGTFHNQAVLRAFEKIVGADVTCPDISGVMGAFGAALLARRHYRGQETAMLPLDEILNLTYSAKTARCGGCENHCMLTVNTFAGGRRHITGNRCEKPLGAAGKTHPAPNMPAYKRQRLFAYPPLEEDAAPRGVLGIPRALNLYENYPYWATFFRELGFRVVLSPLSDRRIYELGMESIPSESECYPAKLTHGHVQWLVNQGIRTIFHPCVFYEHQETPGAQNHFNCPIVVSYPENIRNNVEAVADGDVRYIRPFIAFTSEKTAADRLVRLCRDEWQIPEREVRAAARAAWDEQQRAKADIRAEGARLLAQMEQSGGRGVVLAGRPYHVDPEINHGIPELIASFGLTVFTEDSLPIDFTPTRPLRVVDQWVYHSRLYSAAEFVARRRDLELIQLNSFGCGLDAVTTDQVQELLEEANKLYTVLKIDEVNNLGAARIRVRSLMAVLDERKAKKIKAVPVPPPKGRVVFTKAMKKAGYTILAPQISPIHLSLLQEAIRAHGYNLVVLPESPRATDVGLKYVNNDACYPTILTVGQLVDALQTGQYDLDHTAVIMTQTGGGCRATNYIALIRKALRQAGMPQVPVISLSFTGIEKNPGFTVGLGALVDMLRAVLYGDLLMRCLYRTRPYEKVKGTADALYRKWDETLRRQFRSGRHSVRKNAQRIVADFSAVEISDVKKPRVGVVGEILVKFHPVANNRIVNLIESEGGEAVVPDFLDFFLYGMYNNNTKYELLDGSALSKTVGNIAIRFIEHFRKPFAEALEGTRFGVPADIYKLAEAARHVVSTANMSGEGWFLTAEMLELMENGTNNIVCVQPFACLPNHVTGKGVMKELKRQNPQANIVAVDYDPGASEVNQINRIKLMMSVAFANLQKL